MEGRLFFSGFVAVCGMVTADKLQPDTGMVSKTMKRYAYFHDARLEYLKIFVWTYIITWMESMERVNEDVRVYFCWGSGKEMGYF